MNTNTDIKTASSPEQNQDRAGRPETPANPSDAYPPTRPGPIIIIIALLLVVVVVGIENWPDVSALVRSAGL